MEMEAKLKKAFINLENYHDKLQIEFAYLFGSYAEGNYAPTSDIDLAVYFVSNPSWMKSFPYMFFNKAA